LILAAAAESSSAIALTITAILASAVVVLGGLAALVRAIWKTATVLRDNTLATKDLTDRLEEYNKAANRAYEALAIRVNETERELDMRRGRSTPSGP